MGLVFYPNNLILCLVPENNKERYKKKKDKKNDFLMFCYPKKKKS